MNIIIPMAGLGKRMRPHTLTVPKPLIKIAGKSIVERLVEQIATSSNQQIDKIGFIIRERDDKVENELSIISEKFNAIAKFYVQEVALGTAHAIDFAKELLEGPVIIAFADTLFKAKFNIDKDDEGIIWVKEVDDPSQFGVVQVDDNDIISNFIEKPKEKIYNKAIIGIYYFKQAELLRKEIKYLIDNDLTVKGEFQLTDALENLKNKKIRLKAKEVDKWMDCGNKNATVETNSKIIEINKETFAESNYKNVSIINSLIIEPVYIGKNVMLIDSVIGPHVSVEEGTRIENSVIKKSIIQSNCNISGDYIVNSMIGNNVEIVINPKDYSIGDYLKMQY